MAFLWIDGLAVVGLRDGIVVLPTLGVRVVVCGGGHRGWDCVLLLVGGRVDSWVGIARRGCVLLARGGGSGIGIARRECASGLRFVVDGCARRECGIFGIGRRDCLSFLLVRDCRIAGLLCKISGLLCIKISGLLCMRIAGGLGERGG